MVVADGLAPGPLQPLWWLSQIGACQEFPDVINGDSNLSHYSDVIMGSMASEITSFIIVYSTVYSGADHRKCQSFASLTFVRGIHRSPVNSPHKGPVTRKTFPFDDVIINQYLFLGVSLDTGHQRTCVMMKTKPHKNNFNIIGRMCCESSHLTQC